jgi:hypothetical protein
VLCPSCHFSNPENNRFCGNCGAKLETAADPRRRRGDELPEELIEFDKKIPLIAEPGTDRRNAVPEKIREKVQEVLERDRAREAEREREVEAQREAREREIAQGAEREREREARLQRDREITKQREARERAERERQVAIDRERDARRIEREPEIARERERELERYRVTVPPDEQERPVQLPSGFLGLNTVEPPRDVERLARATSPRVEGEPRVTRSSNNQLWNVEDEHRSTPTGVVGPSFLGLSDALEEVEQDEPESHWRRNVSLLVLLLLIGLGATQWKAIRDQGLPFVKNGTQQVMMKMKGKQQPPPLTDESANSSNANSAPNMEVGPLNENLKKQQEAAANATPPADNNAANTAAINVPPATGAAATSTTTPADASRTSKPSDDATKNSAATDPAANAAAPATTGGAVGAAIPEGSSTAKADDGATSEPAKPVSKETEKPAVSDASPRNRRKPSGADRPQITEEATQAGNAEYERALVTSDPGLQRSLLWQAIKKGNSDASVKLAELYIEGRGVEKSCDQAMVLLRSASAHSSARARGKLGAMYATGACVQQDRVQAYHWMSMALQANPNSDWTARYRDNLWNQMTAAEKMRAGRDR